MSLTTPLLRSALRTPFDPHIPPLATASTRSFRSLPFAPLRTRSAHAPHTLHSFGGLRLPHSLRSHTHLTRFARCSAYLFVAPTHDRRTTTSARTIHNLAAAEHTVTAFAGLAVSAAHGAGVVDLRTATNTRAVHDLRRPTRCHNPIIRCVMCVCVTERLGRREFRTCTVTYRNDFPAS